MALFLRRQLQRCIDLLGAHLPPDAVRQLVKGLNSGGVKPLATEWEVIILWAVAQSLRVEYEPGDPNARRLDLVVYSRITTRPLFSADIRCVSDRGFHEENPTDDLVDLLERAWRDSGLKGSLEWEVDYEMDRDTYGDQRVRLSLPRESDTLDALACEVQGFLSSCKGAQRRVSHDFSSVLSGFRVTFDPGGWGFSGHHLSYTSVYSKRRNPVATALRKKRQQLVALLADGSPQGIILCDGGCSLLASRSAAAGDFSLRDVVIQFLAESPEVDFVLTLGIESSYGNLLNSKRESHEIYPQVFGHDGTRERLEPIVELFRWALARLPSAELSPHNAHQKYLDNPGEPWSRRQPMTWSNTSITVSARWLMDVLAGKVSPEKALEQHSMEINSTKGENANPFKQMIDAGRLPVSAQVHKKSDSDDDQIEFIFGNPDAALAPFRTTDSSESGERPLR